MLDFQLIRCCFGLVTCVNWRSTLDSWCITSRGTNTPDPCDVSAGRDVDESDDELDEVGVESAGRLQVDLRER